MPGSQMGMVNLGEMFGKAFGARLKRKRMTVAQSYHRVDGVLNLLVRHEPAEHDQPRRRRAARASRPCSRGTT